MKTGYLISSHVVQNHAIIPPLLKSLRDQVPFDSILVVVNGSESHYSLTQESVRFVFQPGNWTSHFLPALEQPETHWFFINGTSTAGPYFHDLVQAGFKPDADATIAGQALIPGRFSSQPRAINDLAMYRADYLRSQVDFFRTQQHATLDDLIRNYEGALYAMAKTKAAYPTTGCKTLDARDVYGTGTMRITEFYPGIDWYRYKKNWGQIEGHYDKLAL